MIITFYTRPFLEDGLLRERINLKKCCFYWIALGSRLHRIVLFIKKSERMWIRNVSPTEPWDSINWNHTAYFSRQQNVLMKSLTSSINHCWSQFRSWELTKDYKSPNSPSAQGVFCTLAFKVSVKPCETSFNLGLKVLKYNKTFIIQGVINYLWQTSLLKVVYKENVFWATDLQFCFGQWV